MAHWCATPATFDLIVHAEGADPVSTVVARGELDLACAEQLGATVRDEVRRGWRHVRVDLSQVSFLDATVLDVLVQAHRELLRSHGTLVLTGVGRRVQRLIDATGLDDVLFVVGPRPLPRNTSSAYHSQRRGLHRLAV